MQPDVIEVRSACVADVEAIREVARKSWADVYATIMPSFIQSQALDQWYSTQALEQGIRSDRSVFLVAEVRHSVVAFLQIVPLTRRACELTRIYVLPEQQRQGIGAQLIRAAVRETGPDTNQLVVHVEERNERALRFYDRIGFRNSGTTAQDLFGQTLNVCTLVWFVHRHGMR